MSANVNLSTLNYCVIIILLVNEFVLSSVDSDRKPENILMTHRRQANPTIFRSMDTNKPSTFARNRGFECLSIRNYLSSHTKDNHQGKYSPEDN